MRGLVFYLMMHLLYPRKRNSVREGPGTATRPGRGLSAGFSGRELAGRGRAPLGWGSRGAALLLPGAQTCLQAPEGPFGTPRGAGKLGCPWFYTVTGTPTFNLVTESPMLL